MAIDEKLLEPVRDHLAMLNAHIKQAEIEVLEKIERAGDDEAYERELWRRYYDSIQIMVRERESVTKLLADYYGLQPMPIMLITPHTPS